MINKTEQDRLQILLKDDFLFVVVQKILTDTIEEEKPVIGENISNVLIGEKYRAYDEAKKILEKGIKKLKTYKIITDKDKININRAR